MKRIIAIIILSALPLCMRAAGEGQKTVEMTVQDVLALVPCQDTSAFYSAFDALGAGAPESVAVLCSMMEPDSIALRTGIEYALSGLAVYASTERGASCRKAVAQGFRDAVAATDDDVFRTFLEMQLRLADPAASAAPAKLAPDYTKVKAPVINLKKYDRLTDAQKADVLYWTGESRDSTKLDFVISQMTSPSAEVVQAAAVAASKIGTARATAALISVLGVVPPDIPGTTSGTPAVVVYDANGNKVE